jgi:hypothetical protein
MESAKRYVERYREMRVQFLEERTFELFRAILKLLGHVLQFFVDRRLSASDLPSTTSFIINHSSCSTHY